MGDADRCRDECRDELDDEPEDDDDEGSRVAGSPWSPLSSSQRSSSSSSLYFLENDPRDELLDDPRGVYQLLLSSDGGCRELLLPRDVRLDELVHSSSDSMFPLCSLR